MGSPRRRWGSGTEPLSRGPGRAGPALRGCGERGPGPLRRLWDRGRSRSGFAQRDIDPRNPSVFPAPQRDTEIGEKTPTGLPGPGRGTSASAPGLGARSRGSAEHGGVCRVCPAGSSPGRVLPSGQGALSPGPCQESWSPAGRDAEGSGAHLMAGFLACLVSAPSASLADNSFTTYLLKGEIYKKQKK